MRDLLQQYFRIAFLMGKPQDLPGGRAQLHLGIAASLVTYVLAVSIPFGVERAFLQALVDLGCTGLAMRMALGLLGHPARFEQAFGGLCGASMFINLAAVPLFALRPTVAAGEPSMGLLADFVLLVWGLSLMAHVIRHTFEVRMFTSVMLSVAFFIVLSSLVASLWPQPVSDSDADRISMVAAETIVMSDQAGLKHCVSQNETRV